jgi:hypothetical protein
LGVEVLGVEVLGVEVLGIEVLGVIAVLLNRWVMHLKQVRSGPPVHFRRFFSARRHRRPRNDREPRSLICLCGKERSKIMRTLIVALATVAALDSVAHAGAIRKPPHHPIRVPLVMSDPYWVPDYNIVPRYRYRAEDDRVDTSPTAKPVEPDDGDYGGTGGSGW